MPKLDQYLRSVSRQRSDSARGWRALATLLCLILAFGALAPTWALAGEPESEGEGGAPPGGVPGLEEGPEFEPGGEETPLEELPPLPGEEGEEEAPVEAEPPVQPEAPPPGAEGVGAEALPEDEPPVATEVPSSPVPVYESPSGPAYQTEAVPASSAPVENQPLVDPQSAPSTPHPQREEKVVQVSPEAPPPAAPPEEPELASTQRPATSVEPDNGAKSFKGRDFHTVAPGESLWSIATALLPPGAGNAEIAAEVARLWQLNKSRVGTGDPNLILVGTELRLR